jgi:peptidoglycan/xylan/chitin deacetylase (PgdA/CDA1 family)
VPERRAIAKRAHAEGHWIGNHTMTHSTPLGRLADPGKAIGEIVEAQALIDELAHPDRLFRPFGGGGELGRHLLNDAAVQVLASERMTCVLWNAIPRDWEDPRGWAGWRWRSAGAALDPPRAATSPPARWEGSRSSSSGFATTAAASAGHPVRCVPILRGEARAPLEPPISPA